MLRREFELIIAGAGPIGLATALAAKLTFGEQARILVCDPHVQQTSKSIRTFAVSAAPRYLLERIGVWGMLDTVQPILRMDITDSALEDTVRQSFLGFEPPRNSVGALAYMVAHDDLMQALMAQAIQTGVEFRAANIISFTAKPASVSVSFQDGTMTTGGLLIACDGANSSLRQLARIPVTGWDYNCHAIVATITAERDHEGLAVQHFLPDGTFALLPMRGKRFSIVWVESSAESARICGLNSNAFNEELQHRAGSAFGKLALLEGPQRFPLRLLYARRFFADRLALVGDAAHSMHPLAGQGLNLGLRDVAFLMEVMTPRLRLGLDPGTFRTLKDYDRSRQFDTARMLAATDALFHLFTAKIPAFRILRDTSLGLVDRLPSLKNQMIKSASGDSPDTPFLLRAS